MKKYIIVLLMLMVGMAGCGGYIGPGSSSFPARYVGPGSK